MFGQVESFKVFDLRIVSCLIELIYTVRCIM